MRKVEGLKKVESPASHLSRRETVKLLGMVPLGLALAWTPSPTQVERFLRTSLAPRPSALDPKFFTSEEYQTVRLLADLIIPRDERSGSASDAGVPEFMDFMMADQDTSAEARTAMRGGLAWTDAECDRRYGKRFVDCSERERIGLLDGGRFAMRAAHIRRAKGRSHG